LLPYQFDLIKAGLNGRGWNAVFHEGFYLYSAAAAPYGVAFVFAVKAAESAGIFHIGTE
jgi:hypothetical protein